MECTIWGFVCCFGTVFKCIACVLCFFASFGFNEEHETILRFSSNNFLLFLFFVLALFLPDIFLSEWYNLIFNI